jgi:hypothetical protein
MTNMRAFISGLPNAADLDPVKRTAAEREIEQRVRGLSAADRASFESTLRSMAREQRDAMSFEQKWGAARHHAALKEQLTQGNGEK